MINMIDMHSHVLPGIDDGAKSVDESLQMLSESYKQGVKICAATPHLIIHKQKDLDDFLENRQKAYEKLMHEIEKSNGDYPEIVLGGEVYLDNDLTVYEGLEKVCYTNTSYMLLEFPMDKVNPGWAEWIYEFNRKGIKILIAHVDRYPEWEKMMSDFRGLDVTYQVNASRFLKFSDKRLLKNLLEYGFNYIISSDMHNTRTRVCNMGDAYLKAQKKYGDKADKLFYKNADKLLKSGM